MTDTFEGAPVLITGGSSGIGAGLAEASATSGATVGIVEHPCVVFDRGVR